MSRTREAEGSEERGRTEKRVPLIEIVVGLALVIPICVGVAEAIDTQLPRTAVEDETLAVRAARGVIEEIRETPIERVVALYNTDPEDDPGGQGTAPGGSFAVDGLGPIDGDPDGLVGAVMFPLASPEPQRLPVVVRVEWQDDRVRGAVELRTILSAD